MWGAIAGIAAASLALAVLHQTLEATGLSEKKPKEQGKLPEPGPGFEKRAGAPGTTFCCEWGGMCPFLVQPCMRSSHD